MFSECSGLCTCNCSMQLVLILTWVIQNVGYYLLCKDVWQFSLSDIISAICEHYLKCKKTVQNWLCALHFLVPIR